MYSLSKEQKISNYRELLAAKEKKVQNLQSEINAIQAKLEKLEKTSGELPNELLQAAQRSWQ